MMNVLLTDDSRTIRMILRNLLNEAGIREVSEAENGLQALEAMARQQFDLILIDIHMPEMDGLEVLERIKTDQHCRHHDTPVVIISSDTDYRQIGKARDLGAFGYIKKPFRQEGLEAAIMAAQKNAAVRRRERQAKEEQEPVLVAAVAEAELAQSAPAPQQQSYSTPPAPAYFPQAQQHVPQAADVVPPPAAASAPAPPMPIAEPVVPQPSVKAPPSGGILGWLGRLMGR